MKKEILQNAIQTPDGTILISLGNKVEAHKDANGEVYHISGGTEGFVFKSVNKVQAEDLTLMVGSPIEDFLDKSLVIFKEDGVDKIERVSKIPTESLEEFIAENINTKDENTFLNVSLVALILGKRRVESLKVKDNLKETVSPKPAYLFTTEDGEKMYEGDTWWTVVLDGVRIPKETKTMDYKGSNPSKNVVTFSSKGLAYKVALEGMDRAQVLTLNDVSMNIGQLDRLENIAKSRFLNSHPVKQKDSDKKYSRKDIILLLENSGAFAERKFVTKFVDSILK